MDNPDTLKISVSEEIKSSDIPPGMPEEEKKKIEEEKLPAEEVEKRQKIMLEYTRLMGRYCAPHNKKSRWVTDKDLPRVFSDGRDLMAMCSLPRGKHGGASAISHTQIEEKDPLRFFVFPNGLVIINPVIVNHTKVPIFKEEGCMSYPDNDIKTMVPRYNKVTVTYQTLAVKDPKNPEDTPVLTRAITETLNGGPAHVFQHECGHLNGCNVYDEDFDPEKSIGLGGEPIGYLPEWKATGEVEEDENKDEKNI